MSVSNIHKAYQINGRNLITEPYLDIRGGAVKQLTFPLEPNLAKRRSPMGSFHRTKYDDYPHSMIEDWANGTTRWIRTTKSAHKSKQLLQWNLHKWRPPLRSVPSQTAVSVR